MQGLSLPSRKVCSASPLPAAQLRPTSPQPPPEQSHVFEEVMDTVGQARIRGMPPAGNTRDLSFCTHYQHQH